MTRAKLLIIIVTFIVVLGVVGGVGYLVFNRLRGPASTATVTGPQSVATPPTAAGQLSLENVALPETPIVASPPDVIAGTVTRQDPAKVIVYEPGSRGMEGEAPATRLSQVLTEPSTATADEGTVAIPDSSVGTGSAPVASSGAQGSTDEDEDGLTFDQELQLGTDPKKADTDADGLKDGEEARTYRSDPKVPDTDGDGLTDGDEVHTWKTDPLNPDTDADTYPDGVEVKGGYNPRGPGKL